MSELKRQLSLPVLQSEKQNLDLKGGSWLYNLHVPQNSEGYKFGKI